MFSELSISCCSCPLYWDMSTMAMKHKGKVEVWMMVLILAMILVSILS